MKYLAILMLCLSGCVQKEYVPVNQPAPVISLPARPTMTPLTLEEKKAWDSLPDNVKQHILQQNEDIKLYASELEVTLKAYNSWAEKTNTINAQFLGLKAPGEKK